MQICDEDMQMVRDALAASPEFVKGHFENLLTQYETVSALKMFRSRTEQPTDELHVYEGDLSSWLGKDPRFVGKVAYHNDGKTVDWFAK